METYEAARDPLELNAKFTTLNEEENCGSAEKYTKWICPRCARPDIESAESSLLEFLSSQKAGLIKRALVLLFYAVEWEEEHMVKEVLDSDLSGCSESKKSCRDLHSSLRKVSYLLVEHLHDFST